MSFSEAENDKLINIIAKYPVIYDTGHVSYRNNLVKENVWKSIAKELNRNPEECKKKWKFIRDGYNRFKNKHKLGTGSAAPKNSKDQRHQQLLFLDGVSQHRSGGSNIPSSPQELTENEEDADELSSEKQVLVGESADPVLSINNEAQEGDDNIIIETINDEPREQIQPKEKRRKRNKEDQLLKMWKERDEKGQTLLKLTLKKHDDDVELFSRHIAEVLRNLPPVEKAEAKKHLSLVLSDYEIKAARNASSTRSSSALSHYTSTSDFTASASSSEYPSPMPDRAYDLPGPSNAPQFPNLSYYTAGPVHYNMPNAYSPISAMPTSPEPTVLSSQANQESEESQNETEYHNL